MPLTFPTEVLAGNDEAEALRFCSCRVSRSNFFWLRKAFKSSTGTPRTITLGFGTGGALVGVAGTGGAVEGVGLVTFSFKYPVILGWFGSNIG